MSLCPLVAEIFQRVTQNFFISTQRQICSAVHQNKSRLPADWVGVRVLSHEAEYVSVSKVAFRYETMMPFLRHKIYWQYIKTGLTDVQFPVQCGYNVCIDFIKARVQRAARKSFE